MPKTIEVTVYEINELDEWARKSALDNHRYWNVEIDDWYDFIYEDWKMKLADLGYEDVDICFSGFWSQGDGASFTAENIDIPKWIEASGRTGEFPNVYKADGYLAHVSGHVYRSGSHYVHENTVSVDVYGDVYDEETIDAGAFTNELDELEKALQYEVRELSKQIYRELGEEYEHQTADEQVVESLEANEVMFYSDGRPFPMRFLEVA